MMRKGMGSCIARRWLLPLFGSRTAKPLPCFDIAVVSPTGWKGHAASYIFGDRRLLMGCLHGSALLISERAESFRWSVEMASFSTAVSLK